MYAKNMLEWNARLFLYQAEMRQTGTRGDGDCTRKEAHGGADCESAATGLKWVWRTAGPLSQACKEAEIVEHVSFQV
jgi:hypothetical protein